jgi:hypothetical protein
MSSRIRLRRDTAANWTANNPVLALGEPGLETDTRQLKFGDGTTAWTSLVYGAGGAPVASTSVSGTVKVDGTSIVIANGVISATGELGIPVASTSVLGGVKIDGTSISITNGVISASVTGVYNNATFTGTTTIQQTQEVVQAITSASGTVTHDFSQGQIWQHTTPASNFVANFTNVPTTANRSCAVTLILNQGANPYIANGVQINGVNQSIKWAGGVQPAGTGNKTDVLTFIMTYVGGNWSVFGQMSSYG